MRDQNFDIARKINWSTSDLIDAFRDAASSCHGVRMLFACDNGNIIDFCVLDFPDPFRNQRVESLLKHDYIPIGFCMRSRSLSGVVYLPQFDRVRLGSWALELLTIFNQPDRTVAQDSFDVQEQIEMRQDQRDAEWYIFISHLAALPDHRESR